MNAPNPQIQTPATNFAVTEQVMAEAKTLLGALCTAVTGKGRVEGRPVQYVRLEGYSSNPHTIKALELLLILSDENGITQEGQLKDPMINVPEDAPITLTFPNLPDACVWQTELVAARLKLNTQIDSRGEQRNIRG